MKIDLAQMVRRAGRTKQTQIVAREITPTGAQRGDLLNLYARIVRQWGRLVPERIMPAYERSLAAVVRDSPDDVQGAVDDVSAAMSRLVLALNANLEDWVVRVEQWHRQRFAQAFTPVGVDLGTMLGRGDVATTLQSVLNENLSLIRSLDDQLRNGISGSVFRGLANRSPAVEVAREIRKVAAVARKRAELIAADQLQKLTARLDQERQEQVGIEKFEWMHSGKAHPRPEHKARNGIIYRWDSAVAKSDPPGRAIRCGCRAKAVLELESTEAAPVVAQATPDAEAKRYVVDAGKRTGREHLVAFDQRTGAEIERSSGSESHVDFSRALVAALEDRKRQIVVHHNHPASGSFSQADLMVLRKPGAKAIWAHGHNGSSFGAERGTKTLFPAAYKKAADQTYKAVQKVGEAGLIDSADANLLYHHLLSQVLHDRGYIKYDATLAGTSAEAWQRRSAMLSVIREALK